MTKRPKILWGVCGIGNGHTSRQLPLIEHFAENSDIIIFAYGESLDALGKRFKDMPNVTVESVAVPFYVGNDKGIDFEATEKHSANQNIDFYGINSRARDNAFDQLGRPDLVISDYEPVSAQYAYWIHAPFVTIDQQNKYLSGEFPQPLNGYYNKDETARLSLFFPLADARLACSFFRVEEKAKPHTQVELFPSILSDRITHLKRDPDPKGKTILVYESAQQPFPQNHTEIADVFAQQTDVQFHLFGKALQNDPAFEKNPNIIVYPNGDPTFFDILERCNGVVMTAGHGLMSETMHLGIPVFAVPLPIYEQQMNAHVIDVNHFGMSRPVIDTTNLNEFIENIPSYAVNIVSDKDVLMRSQGKDAVIARLEKMIYG